jgi:hypothetical protein
MSAMVRSATIALILLLVAGCAAAPPLSQVTSQVPLSEGQRHIYWGDETLDWNDLRSDPRHYTATIGGANLDGSGMSESAIVGLDDPCRIAIDDTYVYWANRAGDTIGRAKLDGTGADQAFVVGMSGVCVVALGR